MDAVHLIGDDVESGLAPLCLHPYCWFRNAALCEQHHHLLLPIINNPNPPKQRVFFWEKRMYCSVDYDLRRYMATEDAAEEAATAAHIAAEEDFVSAVAECNPAARLPSTMFPQIADVFFDVFAASGYKNDKVVYAAMRALMEASRRGDVSAIEAMDTVQAHYMERV